MQARSTVTAAPVSPPPNDPAFRFETRLAVVLYGGVSLAIYIHGVTQELLGLVRATAPGSDAREPRAALVPDADLSPVERIYREVGRRLGGRDPYGKLPDSVRTRIVVDVLSGTSAGGLNGLFLAKALANGTGMRALKDLWIEEGDLGLLLNDEVSQAGVRLKTRPPALPSSLLNSQRMLSSLLVALRKMNPAEPRTEPMFADELDLFVTATDLNGVALPLRIANGLTFEDRHRAVFHFIGATDRATGGSRNDFRAESDAFLAFAGRCTSSVPVAFEPMELSDLGLLVDGMTAGLSKAQALAAWQRFFRDYARRLTTDGKPDPVECEEFSQRPFGDGGYLDNKPFSHAIDALQWRQAGANVQRKLIYVEPSPEHPEERVSSPGRPDPFSNLLAAASTLPRQETIREDLERVLERNRRIEHVQRAVRFVNEDTWWAYEDRRPPVAQSGGSYAARWLNDALRDYGAAYGAYHRLKVAVLTSELAEVVARVCGLDEDSDDVLAVRMLMSAWRQQFFDSERPDPAAIRDRQQRGLPGESWESENQLLLQFDLSYRLRRIAFVRDLIQGLAGLEPSAGAARAPDPRSPHFSSDRAAEILGGAGLGEHLGTCRASFAEFQDVLHRDASVLAEMQRLLRTAGRRLRARDGSSPLRDDLTGMKLSAAERGWIREPSRPRERVARARALLGLGRAPGAPPAEVSADERLRLLQAAVATAAAELRVGFERASDLMYEAAPPLRDDEPVKLATPAPVQEIVRRCLRFYYDRFDLYDMTLFVMTYGAGIGEIAEVQVIRVSPEDARGLVCERDPESHEPLMRKLAGTRLADFGAFLDPTWRRSDILWGRLDAAEILLDQLLPRTDDEAKASLRLELIRRAQAAILEEELPPLGNVTGRRVLVEAFLHTHNGQAAPTALTEMLRKVAPHAARNPRLAELLDEQAVMTEYARAFATERNLAAPKAHRLAARSVSVFGRLLQGVSGPQSRITLPLGRYLAYGGRALWGFVECAIPESFPALLVRNWLQLLYLLEALLFVGGLLLPGLHAVRVVGQQLLLGTVGVHLVLATLTLQYRGVKGAWRRLIILVAIVAAGLAIVGGYMLPKFLAGVAAWLRQAMSR